MAHRFSIHPESLRRRLSIYVVVGRRGDEVRLYVGKTGDNREGCNPVISRCGNHFSYNDVHSQVRNHFEEHEAWRYTYVFEHFFEYVAAAPAIDEINEMERWVNREVAKAIRRMPGVSLTNPFVGAAYVPLAERQRREAFRAEIENQAHVSDLLKLVEEELGAPSTPVSVP